MIAVIPVRQGTLPAGGLEAAGVANGRVVLVGDGLASAIGQLDGVGTSIRTWEAGDFAPGPWAGALAPLLVDEEMVLLPASPDGRDLAPRLAAVLERPVFAGAVEVHADTVTTIGHGGAVMVDHLVSGPAVVTLQPGVLGVHRAAIESVAVEQLELVASAVPAATVDEVLEADVTTMDLAEAPRIVGGGAGLDSSDRFVQLSSVGHAIDASMGATRVITDRSWVGHSRQIGTTGVVVDPRLYLAFGISGAVQHTAGLGDPDHIVSVNTDPHCPMMAMADLAVVADANATLEAMADRLGLGETIGG